MPKSLTYLVKRLFYRIFEFLRHWYLKSPRVYYHHVFNMLESLDYRLAWRITLKNLFEPLYKDYSIIGHIIGFLFRTSRLVFGGVIYLILFAFAIAIYLAWLAIPLFIIFQIIKSI